MLYSGVTIYRYDEVISSERIVGTVGKCEKRRMDLSKEVSRVYSHSVHLVE